MWLVFLQTPGRENAEEARSEAERIVDDVLTQASEILQSQTSPTFPPLDNSVGIAIYSPSDDNSPETEDERQDNSTKVVKSSIVNISVECDRTWQSPSW